MEQQQIAAIMEMIATNYQLQLNKLDGNKYYSNLTFFLKEEDAQTVFDNTMKHITTSNYLPTIADLVRKKEVEDRGRYIPNAEETKLMIESNQLSIGHVIGLTAEKKLELDKRMREIMEGVKNRARQSTYDPFS